jgi:hypothetical protein
VSPTHNVMVILVLGSNDCAQLQEDGDDNDAECGGDWRPCLLRRSVCGSQNVMQEWKIRMVSMIPKMLMR